MFGQLDDADLTTLVSHVAKIPLLSPSLRPVQTQARHRALRTGHAATCRKQVAALVREIVVVAKVEPRVCALTTNLPVLAAYFSPRGQAWARVRCSNHALKRLPVGGGKTLRAAQHETGQSSRCRGCSRSLWLGPLTLGPVLGRLSVIAGVDRNAHSPELIRTGHASDRSSAPRAIGCAFTK